MSRRHAFSCPGPSCHLSGKPCKQGTRARRANGFTLVELMVVVTILSILTLTAGLSVGVGDRGRRSDTDLLTRLDARLRDAALFDRATVGFRIDDDGLQPLSAGPDGWAETGAAITWQGDAEWVDGALTVVAYLPDGRNSPFRVTLRTADVLRDCVSDGWSPVTCDPQ